MPRGGGPKDPEARKEWIAKISSKSKATWTNKTYRQKHKQIMKEVLSRPEVKKALSEGNSKKWSDPISRAKMLEAQTRGANSKESHAKQKAKISTPESREKMAKMMRDKWKDPIYRDKQIAKHRLPHVIEKLSAKAKLQYEQGFLANSPQGKGGLFWSNKHNGFIRYRSGLELSFYKHLEDDPNVRFYRVEPCWIPYLFRGCSHFYIPDLLIYYTNGEQVLVEIKPEWKLKESKNYRQWKAAVRYRKQRRRKFEIWTEKRILKLEEALKEYIEFCDSAANAGK